MERIVSILVALCILICWIGIAEVDGTNSICETSGCTCGLDDIVCSGTDFTNSGPLTFPTGNDGNFTKASEDGSGCTQDCVDCGLQTMCEAWISERRKPEPNVNCIAENDPQGRNYRGTVKDASGGIPCQHWVDQEPIPHEKGDDNFEGYDWHKYIKTETPREAGNSCRNPGNKLAEPWCYVTDASYAACGWFGGGCDRNHAGKRLRKCGIPSCRALTDSPPPDWQASWDANNSTSRSVITKVGEPKWGAKFVSKVNCGMASVVTDCSCSNTYVSYGEGYGTCHGTSVSEDGRYCRAWSENNYEIRARAKCARLSSYGLRLRDRQDSTDDILVLSEPEYIHSISEMKKYTGRASATCPDQYELLHCNVLNFHGQYKTTPQARKQGKTCSTDAQHAGVQAVCIREYGRCLNSPTRSGNTASCSGDLVVTKCECSGSGCRGSSISEDLKTCTAYGSGARAQACCDRLHGQATLLRTSGKGKASCPDGQRRLACTNYVSEPVKLVVKDSQGLDNLLSRVLSGPRQQITEIEFLNMGITTMAVPLTLIEKFPETKKLSLTGNPIKFTPENMKTLQQFDAVTLVIPVDHVTDGQEFSASCLSERCRSACGEPAYLDPSTVSEVAQQHYFHGALDLASFVSNKQDGSTHIWAEYVYSTGPIEIKGDGNLVIITREFHMPEKLNSFFPKVDNPECTIRFQNSTKTGKTMFVMDQGKVRVIAERIRYGAGCVYRSSETEIVKLPADILAMEYMKTLSYCVKLRSRASQDNSLAMLDWVMTVLSWMDGKQTASYYLEADALKADLMTFKASNALYVPALSQNTYSASLRNDAEMVDKYLRTYKQLTDDSQAMGRSLFQAMQNDVIAQESEALQRQNNAYKSLRAAIETTKRMQTEFQSTTEQLEEARKTFDTGYWAEVSFNSLLTVTDAASALVNFEPSNAMRGANRATKLGKFILDIANVLFKVHGLRKTCLRRLAIFDKIKGVDDIDLDDVDWEKLAEDTSQVVELETQVVEWDNLKNAVRAQLGGGAAHGIYGVAGFETKIHEMANWGKAMTEATIEMTARGRRYLSEKAAYEGRADHRNYIDGVLNRMGAADKPNLEQAQALLLQALELKWDLTDSLVSYCQAYFYAHYQPCAANVMPSSTDDLERLQEKLLKAQSNNFDALESHKVMYTRKMTVIINDNDCRAEILSSSETGERKNSLLKTCPIALFKDSGSLLYNLSLSEPTFEPYDDVRVQDMDVELIGATTESESGEVMMNVTSLGYFQNRNFDREFNFTMARSWRRVQIYHPGQADSYRSVPVGQDHYTKLTPFTLWTISVRDDSLANLEQVTEIRLVFYVTLTSKGMKKRSV